MYPMTGSARMIISPSSSRMIRSTPWVEGCWGPMLRIISSVRSGPSATTSMPPPRSIQASLAAVNAARSLTSISEQGNRGPSAQLCQHLTCSGLLADRAQLVEDCQRPMENGRCFCIATARHERLRERQLGAGCLPPRPEVGERVLGAPEERQGVIQVLRTCGGRPALQPVGESLERDGASRVGVRPRAPYNCARFIPSLLLSDEFALRFEQQRSMDACVQDLIV